MSIAGVLHPTPVLCSASPPPNPRRSPNTSLSPFPPPSFATHRRIARFNLLIFSSTTRRLSSASNSPPEAVSEDEEKDIGGVVERKARRVSISDWTTSILLFGFYAAIMYYVTQLSPNQTPSRDLYFIKKLLNLKGDDGFRMNEVLVALWYAMGLWPIVYSMLLLPTGRSLKSSIPVWPFLSLSFFFGAYALIPYFILWKPPPPPLEEEEIRSWPLNFLESKITAGVALAAALGLSIYAGLADGNVWKEFFQYFRESRLLTAKHVIFVFPIMQLWVTLVHVTCTDFTLLSAFSTFWVYNDMTARRFDKGTWLLPLALVPIIGPSVYLLLRPSLSALPTTTLTNRKD